MRAVVFVLLAAVLFGTTGTAQAFGPEDASPLSVGAARILVGGIGLAVIAFVLARRAPTRPVAMRGALDRRAVAVTVFIGALGVVAYQPAFFFGTSRNGVAIGTIVALGSAPVLTGVLNWFLRRTFPGARWAVATMVAAFGVALLGLFSGESAEGAVDPAGLLGSLAAGTSYAVYTLASKRLLDLGWAPTRAMGAIFGGAAVLALPLLAATDTGWLVRADGLAMTLWLGLGTVTVAYVLFARGLRELSAPTVSTLTLAEPLTATLLGLLLLRETLAPLAWLGLAAIAVGILVLVVSPRRRTTEVAA